MVRIAPSVLSADFSRLSEQLASVEQGGADLIHVDVMDGHFVPNITFGPIIVSALRKLTRLPLGVHLMISEPWRYVSAFCDAGADYLSFHWEVFSGRAGVAHTSDAEELAARRLETSKKEHVDEDEHPDSSTSPGNRSDKEHGERKDLIESTIQTIKEKNVSPGLAINPQTSASHILPFLDRVELVVVMSVHPGFGGQGFVEEVLPKIYEISRQREAHKFEIEVDGGVNLETAPAIAKAGATILAAGSYIFCSPDPALAVRTLRKAAAGPGSAGKL